MDFEKLMRFDEEFQTEKYLLRHRTDERLLERLAELKKQDSDILGEPWYLRALQIELSARILSRLIEMDKAKKK